MKKVSVIVPVYNVADYLERCLNSLAKQTLDDIEIIVVNDGSTDNSQEIIDLFQEKYSDRIIGIEIENSGVAHARNVGLKKASGEFVGFVDSDDYVDVNMFEQLYDKAKEETADIVVSGYTRVYAASSRDFQLGEIEIYGKSLKESPQILSAGVPYIWNKIFSRKMIEENEITFNEFGIFEDLLFTYQCFLYAERISKRDQAYYYYRVSREGSATHHFSDKFFDIFNVIDLLTQEAKKVGLYERLKEQLVYTALNHTIIRWETKVNPEELEIKRAFYKRSMEYIRKNFPNYREHKLYFEKYPHKDPSQYFSEHYWNRRFKKDLVSPPKPVSYPRRAARKVRNKLRKIKKETMNSMQSKSRNPAAEYLKYAKELPIHDKWIFFDPQHGADMNGNMFYLLKEMYFNDLYTGYHYYIAVEKKRLDEFKKKLSFYGMKDVTFVLYESSEHLKIMAAAKYLFTDTSFPVYFIKRKGQVYLNTWHGTPFKTLGRSSHDEMHRIGNLQRNFRIADFILYPSEYMKEHMLEDYMLDNISDNQIMLTGYPRNVVFFEKPNQKIIEAEGLEGKEVIAYLPTWRGNLNDASGEDEIIAYLRQMDDSLNSSQLCYVNLHPYLKGSIDFSQFKNLRTIPFQYETYDFLNCCDTLITDYSSVFFDFATSGKKIVLFAYDEEEYFRDRGVYFDFKELPFTKVRTVDELMTAVKEPIRYDDTEFLKKFCPYEGGDVAKKICEQIVLNRSTDLIIEDVPDNQKENVLVFIGSMRNNLIIDQLYNTLYEMDFEHQNVYLTFRSWKVAKNKRVLRTLPKNIKYLSQLGGVSATNREARLLHRFYNHPEVYGKNKEQLDALFLDEKKRLFDHTKIDKIIYYGAYDRMEMAVLGKFDCKKYFYIASPNFKEVPVSPLIYKMYDEIWVNDKETKEYIKQQKYAKKIKILKEKEELFL